MRFFHKVGNNYKTYCLGIWRSANISQSDVQKCPSCAAEIQGDRPYCPSCGKSPKVVSGPSYRATWIFAFVGLLVILFYWMAITGNDQPASSAPPPRPTLDDAAKLIANCGKPDADSITPAKLRPKVPERRTLLYKSAKVRAVFQKDAAQPTAGWKSARYLDPTSMKQLNQQQVSKRLPCAVSVASSP